MFIDELSTVIDYWRIDLNIQPISNLIDNRFSRCRLIWWVFGQEFWTVLKDLYSLFLTSGAVLMDFYSVSWIFGPFCCIFFCPICLSFGQCRVILLSISVFWTVLMGSCPILLILGMFWGDFDDYYWFGGCFCPILLIFGLFCWGFGAVLMGFWWLFLILWLIWWVFDYCFWCGFDGFLMIIIVLGAVLMDLWWILLIVGMFWWVFDEYYWFWGSFDGFLMNIIDFVTDLMGFWWLLLFLVRFWWVFDEYYWFWDCFD